MTTHRMAARFNAQSTNHQPRNNRSRWISVFRIIAASLLLSPAIFAQQPAADSPNAVPQLVDQPADPMAAYMAPAFPEDFFGQSYGPGQVGCLFTLDCSAQYATSYSARNLPPGLTIDSNGTISGAPSKAGNYNIIVTAKNKLTSVSGTIPFHVDPQTQGASLQPGIPMNTYVGFQNEWPIPGVLATSFSGKGLPPGLKVDSASGCIIGAATTAGTWNKVVITCANSAGAKSGTMTIIVAPKRVPVFSAGAAEVTGTAGVALEYSAAVADVDGDGLPDADGVT